MTRVHDQLSLSGAGTPSLASRGGAAQSPLPRRRRPNPNRWHKSVQYRWPCDGCGETHQVAVIKLRDGSVLRLCFPCYQDGWW